MPQGNPTTYGSAAINYDEEKILVPEKKTWTSFYNQNDAFIEYKSLSTVTGTKNVLFDLDYDKYSNTVKNALTLSFIINRQSHNRNEDFKDLQLAIGGLDLKMPKLVNSSGMTNFTGNNRDLKYRINDLGEGKKWDFDQGQWVGTPNLFKVTIKIPENMVDAALRGPVVIYDGSGDFEIGKIQSRLRGDNLDVKQEIKPWIDGYYHEGPLESLDANSAEAYTNQLTLQKLNFFAIQQQMMNLKLTHTELIENTISGISAQIVNTLNGFEQATDSLADHFMHYAYEDAWAYQADEKDLYVNGIKSFIIQAEESYESWADTMPNWSSDAWDSVIVKSSDNNDWLALFNAVSLLMGVTAINLAKPLGQANGLAEWTGFFGNLFGNVGGLIGNTMPEDDGHDYYGASDYVHRTHQITDALEIAYDFASDHVYHNDQLHSSYNDAIGARTDAAEAYSQLVLNLAAARFGSHDSDNYADIDVVRQSLGDLGFKTRKVKEYVSNFNGNTNITSLKDTYVAIDNDFTQISANLDQGDYLMYSIDEDHWITHDLQGNMWQFAENSWQNDNI